MFHQRGRSYLKSYWKNINCHHRGDSKEGSVIVDIYKFKHKMANSLSVMTNVLRNVVSKQRIRYKEKGFNLDLAYICDNIIAMGYPADNIERMYRNRLEDVYKFLEENHRDHYKIYNLCLERSYDISKFHGRVAVYPFEDHNPPTIELIQRFCNDVDCWLKADGLNVAAVHCKAGKGRTGTMICCYLLYSGQQSTAEDALSCYGEKRTKDRKGVTIPSQRRYVQYFSKLIRSGLQYERQTLQLCEIRFSEATLLHSQGTVQCSISVLQDTPVKVQSLQNLTIDFRKCFTLDIKSPSLSVAGDIKVELTHKTSRKKLFHFWINTFFVRDDALMEGDGDDAKFVYTLNKCEIDDAHKDKDHKYFSENFKVQLVFCADSPGAAGRTCVINDISNHNVSQAPLLRQNNYMLPQNSSSGNDLNDICDQKSSSSASVSSLNFVGCEDSGGVDEVRNYYKRGGGNSQRVYASPGCEEHSSTSGGTASQLLLTPPPSYAHFNDIDGDIQWQSKTIGPQQHQVFAKANVTATSTPHQKDSNKAIHMFPVCQRQQQYHQPYSSVPKFVRDSMKNKTNTSVQSSSQTHSHHTNNSSKSSSISSHSSTSVVGDNDEEWESGECLAKPLAHNALFSPPMSSSHATHSSLIPASNVHKCFYLKLHSNSSSCKGTLIDNDDGDDDDYNYDYNDDKIPNYNPNQWDLSNKAINCDAGTEKKSSSVNVAFSSDFFPNVVATSHQQSHQEIGSIVGSTARQKLMHVLLTPKTTISSQKMFKRNCSKDVCESNPAPETPKTLMSSCSSNSYYGGLAVSSKNKLKTKLKRNKLMLSQKFEWFQSYFRRDPVDFCKNFEQQTTAMQHNSTSSTNSRSHILSAGSPPSPLPKKLLNTTPPLFDVAETKNETNNSTHIHFSTSNICEDFYSSICDNQLSFNNSPCKSLRSLGDIAIISGSYDHKRVRTAHNVPTDDEFQKNLGSQIDVDNVRRNVVIVAAKPIKTNSIGFNVACLDATENTALVSVMKRRLKNGCVDVCSDIATKVKPLPPMLNSEGNTPLFSFKQIYDEMEKLSLQTEITSEATAEPSEANNTGCKQISNSNTDGGNSGKCKLQVYDEKLHADQERHINSTSSIEGMTNSGNND